MKNIFLTIGLLWISIFASSQVLANEQCRARAYAEYQDALAACGGGTPGGGEQQCAQGTRCHNRSHTGNCNGWSNYEVCGRICKTGRSCVGILPGGACREWQIDAECGNTCSTREVCHSYYPGGSCRDYEVVVNCTQ